MTLRVLCLGAGAVGSLVGARLHEAGVPVALVGRGPHLDAIRRHGLFVEVSAPGSAAPAAEAPVRVPAFPDLAEAVGYLGDPNVVILTVKAYDAAAAAEALTSLSPKSLVLCLQNGVGSEEEVGRRLGRERVVAGVFTLSVDRPSPGRVLVATGQGGIALGPVPGTLGPELAGTVKAAGFRVRTYSRADAVKWSKLLLNLWANALSAVSGLAPRELVRAAPLFHLDWLAFREALKVMRALRIPVVDLPGYPVRLLVRLHRVLPEAAFRRLVGPKVAGGRGGKLPSLWLDLSAGRRVTEVRWLNGAVVEAGRSAGVATPVNQALVRALEAAAEGVGSPSGRLEGLLQSSGRKT